VDSQPQTPIAIPVQCPGDARYDPVRHNREAWLGAYLEDAQEDLKVLLDLMNEHDLHVPGLTIAPEWATVSQFTDGGGLRRIPPAETDTRASDRLGLIRRRIRGVAEAADVVTKLPEAILIWQDTGIRLWGPADAFQVRVIGE
jgi:hypothetical protein